MGDVWPYLSMVAEKSCAAQITWGDGMMMGCITVRLMVRWINGIRRIHAVMAKKPQSVLFMWQRGVSSHGALHLGSGRGLRQPVPALHGNWLLLSEYCDGASIANTNIFRQSAPSLRRDNALQY